MSPLIVFVVLIGAVVPAAYCSDDLKCKEVPNEGEKDLTEGKQKWYYCASSQENRSADYCYVTLEPRTDVGTTKANLTYYNLKKKEVATDVFVMKLNSDKKYEYVDRGPIGTMMASTENCFSYYKCFNKMGNWNGPEDKGEYMMVLCNKPETCTETEGQDLIKALSSETLSNNKPLVMQKFTQMCGP